MDEKRAFYVELKGTDINGAYRQLVETLKKLAAVHKGFSRKCYVVCAETPRLTTTGQRRERAMELNHKVLLKIRKSPMLVDRQGDLIT